MQKHLPSREGNNVITNLAGVLLVLIALLHFLRGIYGWQAQVAGVEIPVYVSWFAFVFALYVAYKLFVMDK